MDLQADPFTDQGLFAGIYFGFNNDALGSDGNLGAVSSRRPLYIENGTGETTGSSVGNRNVLGPEIEPSTPLARSLEFGFEPL